MKGKFPLKKFQTIETPFYYYDVDLLEETLNLVNTEANKYAYQVHYAVKANANSKILKKISQKGLGADCVSGNEVKACIEAGFPVEKIMFAGVGKTDKEINYALEQNIYCFNVESEQEIEVINELAEKKNKTANIAIRINPNIDANTHAKITTGLSENKFGIDIELIPNIIKTIKSLSNIQLIGLHFHLGSQITDLSVFENLCVRINELQEKMEVYNLSIKDINIGGGLGVNYEHPNHMPIPDFESYFRVFHKHLKLKEGQNLHCEPGRSIVAQCGSLITKITYVKEGSNKKFLITDAGMTDLIRPAMYDSYHRIENISSHTETLELYDVVGPICESSDVFGYDRELNSSKRGDLIAIRSAGAYGETMVSAYNLRDFPLSYLSDEL